MTDCPHVYDRPMQSRAAASLKRLSEWIAADPGDVLDLGMGPGSLGRYLNGPLGLRVAVDGVTLNPAEQRAAQAFYRQCWLGDLETLDIAQLLGERRYRWIVCADVLEHLRNPERLLRQCHRLVKASGELLISIPNASYAGLIADLIHGDWRYGPEGLLDRSHVRFFTRRSFTVLLQETGWQPQCIEAVPQPWHETEFHRPFDHLPPCVARYILAQAHTAAYQWIFRAAPADATHANREIAASPVPDVGMASYAMVVYIDDGTGYRADRFIAALASMGRKMQAIDFMVPAGPAPHRLRLDPADRPGYWRLRHMRLRLPDGTLLWQWQPDRRGVERLREAPRHDIDIIGPESSDGGYLLLLLTGDDPQFELPIGIDVMQHLSRQGGILTIVCDWPWSADYMAAIGSRQSAVVSEPRPEENSARSSPLPKKRPLSLRSWLRRLRQRLMRPNDA